jgi:hypothetical protein
MPDLHSNKEPFEVLLKRNGGIGALQNKVGTANGAV